MEQNILDLMNKRREKKKNIPDNRVWSHKCSIHPVDITKVIDTRETTFNYAYSLLFSDNRDIKLNNPIYKRRKINNKKQSNYLKYISNDSEKILNKAYTKINFMKNETKELQKLNTLSLQKTSKSYFRTNRPETSNYRNRIESASTNYQTQTINFNNSKKFLRKSLQNNIKKIFGKNGLVSSHISNEKSDINNNNLYTNNLYSNENTKENTNPNLNSFSKKRNLSSAINKNKRNTFLSLNKSKKSKTNFSLNSPINLFVDKNEEKFRNLIDIDIPKLYSTNKKKHLNLARLNDVYRVQMNKSLRQYNMENHLKELNKIQRDNMSVRQSMENVKCKINQKINDRCQGQYYKKEYLKFKEENEKEKKVKSKEKKVKSKEKKRYPAKIPFNILFRNKDEKKKVKVFPHGYKIRAYYDYCASCDRIEKLKNNDLHEFGDNILFGHLHNKDYDLIYNSLDELFNALEIEPIIKYIDKFKNEKPNKDKNILNDRIQNFFPVLTETEKKIQKMEQHQIFKRQKLIDENIMDKINETKKLLARDKK